MTLAKGDARVPKERQDELSASFRKMMRALFKEEGASLRVEILAEPDVHSFIDTHASVLDSSFEETGMSETTRSRLKESDWIFSGIKTFHELNEAFPSLLDENGERKPFERFLNDVQKIDETYNRNYLYAEYNEAQASAEMAAKWERFGEDGDEYYLQYRTAGDDRVRPEHAELNGVTLPMSDPFWDEYYPPNGWNCRCTVVQVLKSKYMATDRGEAYTKGAKALSKDTRGIFRFNAGKQRKTFPDYNAYTIPGCNTCTKKLNLAKPVASNELCQACLTVRKLVKKEASGELPEDDRKAIRKAVDEWADRHLPAVTLPDGTEAKRLVIKNGDDGLVVNKRFFKETFSMNVRRGKIAQTMEIATRIEEWLPNAEQTAIEAGHHHQFNFLVYEANYNGVSIQCKVKDIGEKIVYTMRIKE